MLLLGDGAAPGAGVVVALHAAAPGSLSRATDFRSGKGGESSSALRGYGSSASQGITLSATTESSADCRRRPSPVIAIDQIHHLLRQVGVRRLEVARRVVVDDDQRRGA